MGNDFHRFDPDFQHALADFILRLAALEEEKAALFREFAAYLR